MEANNAKLVTALAYIAQGKWIVDPVAGTIASGRYHGRHIGTRARNGYLIVFVRMPNGSEAAVLAHRVIWAAAHGTADFGMLNHRNGIKHDNRIDNLEAVTDSENKRHAFAHGLMHVGSRHHNSILTEEDVRLIRSMYVRQNRNRYVGNGLTMQDIATMFGTSKQNVRDIIHRKSWRHVT